MGKDIFQEITPASMQNVTCVAWTLLGGDWHASFVNSLDNGSGMGNPSTYFCQCNYEYEFHIGVDYDKCMTYSVMGNLKHLTEKGFANYRQNTLILSTLPSMESFLTSALLILLSFIIILSNTSIWEDLTSSIVLTKSIAGQQKRLSN